jgi:hypothetical protein
MNAILRNAAHRLAPDICYGPLPGLVGETDAYASVVLPLLAVLHPADRKQIRKGTDAVAWAADVLARHLDWNVFAEFDGEDYDYFLAHFLAEYGTADVVNEIMGCRTCCASYWHDWPRRRRADRAARSFRGPSPIKVARRSKADIEQVKNAIYTIIEADRPMTLRQTFYRLVAAGIVPKEESEYKFTGRLLLDMRRDGEIPYGWISDNTRWMRKPRTFNSVEEALRDTAATYRRAVWRDQRLR